MKRFKLRSSGLMLLLAALLVVLVPTTPTSDAAIDCYYYEWTMELSHPIYGGVCGLYGLGCYDCVCYFGGQPYPC